MSDIAVVIPAWVQNEEQAVWLAEAIQSVLNQTFRNRQIVVVDDNSPVDITTPLTAAPVDHLRLPRHSGPAAARNVGAAYARADWIFCLDADDRLKPDALERLWDARDGDRYVYGDLDFIGDKQGFFPISEWNMDDLRKVIGPIGVTALQPRKLWKTLGGWREDLEGFEDIEYWIRAAECGITGKHIKGAIFDYRIHKASRTARFKASGRGQQLQEAVRQAHLPFLERRQTPPPQPRRDYKMVNGKVEILYSGPRLASFPLRPSPNGTQYWIGGKGDHIWVDPKDVDWLLSFRDGGRQIFEVIAEAPAAQLSPLPAAPIVQPPPDFSSVVVESHVPNIIAMGAKEAAAAVMAVDNFPDLRVLEAVESAREDGPRATVLNAVEKKRKELAG